MAATETLPRSKPAHRLRRFLDAVLLVAIAAILVFPILAKLAADRLPRDAPPALALLRPTPAPRSCGTCRSACSRAGICG